MLKFCTVGLGRAPLVVLLGLAFAATASATAFAQAAGQQPAVPASPTKATAPAASPATTPATTPAKTATPAATPPAAPAKAAAPTTTSAPAAPTGAPATQPSVPVPGPDLATVPAEAKPHSVRLRTLEQKVQALKERAWRSKARVGMLKESVLGGGVGALAQITHKNDMGASYRLIKLVYSLDGVQVFARTDEAAESLYKTGNFEIFTGPISPGTHTLSVVAVYRGHGYGVFKYLDEFVVQARGTHSFTAGEGKTAKVDASGYEKGGPTTPFDKRPAVDFKVTLLTPEKEKPAEPTKPLAPVTPPIAPATAPSASAGGSATLTTPSTPPTTPSTPATKPSTPPTTPSTPATRPAATPTTPAPAAGAAPAAAKPATPATPGK